MMRSRDYRATARGALTGFWLTSILVSLVAGLLGASANPFAAAGGGGGRADSDPTAAGVPEALTSAQLEAIPPFALAIFATLFSFLLLYALVALVIGGAVQLGLVSYNIDLVTRRRTPVFSTLFSRFDIFGKAFLLKLLTSLFVSLWTLLLVIPGIIAAFRYAMAPYLLAENPNLSALEAIRLSKQMMVGNKWRLFKLYFTFAGWAILAVFVTLGIGVIFLKPYIQAAEAAFFLDISRPSAPPPQMEPTYPPAPEM